jgi:hypothetical protein
MDDEIYSYVFILEGERCLRIYDNGQISGSGFGVAG